MQPVRMRTIKYGIDDTFARGSIARRIFILFMLAAFLPTLILAALSFNQVRDVLVSQSHDRLAHTNRTYAMTVYGRLLLAHEHMRQIALGKEQDLLPSSSILQYSHQVFSSLGLAWPDGHTRILYGKTISLPAISTGEHAHLLKGESILLVTGNSGNQPDLLLVQLANTTQPDSPLLVARLDTPWLWGDQDSFPYMTGFCVLSEHNRLLFCNQPDYPPEITASLSPTLSSAEHTSRTTTEDRIISHWQLFLKPKFHHEHWTVFAFQPVLMALAPIGHFSEIFTVVALLTLLLAALLSISQIRRTMGPLEKLIQGTRHIANEDFGYKVDIASQDEFGQLADSFNDMTDRLGRHYSDFQTLARIDQAILTRRDTNTVIGIVLDRIRQMNGAGLAGMTILEEAGTREAKVCVCSKGGAGNIEMMRILLSEEDMRRVSMSPAGFWLENQHDPASWLTTAINEKIRGENQSVFTLPVFYHTKLYALIWLAFPDQSVLIGEMLAHLQQLGDRTGVALSAAARDEQLIYQARHDDLTGLPNRFFFKEKLLQEIAFSQRQDCSFALLFIDLDRFKVINDSFGHSAGDALLVEAAQRLKQCIRAEDMIARLGGG